MIDLIILLMFLAVTAALAATAWAVWVTLRRERRTNGIINGIPQRRIARSLAIAVAALLLITFALGGDDTLRINGQPYHDMFWVRTANMVIVSVTLLLVATSASAIYSMLHKK